MNTMVKTVFSLLVLLLFSAPLSAQEWMGSWTYAAPNAPYGYEKGTLVFMQKDKKPMAQVEIGYSKMEGVEVGQKDKKLKFSLFVDGSEVDVSLTPVSKDELTGTAWVDGTEMKVVAKRKPAKE